MTKRGYTIIELLLVMTIVGILANIAVPTIREMRRRAEGAAVVGDLHAIQTALLDFYADNGSFPPSTGLGSVPAGLETSLPGGFDFQYEDTLYGWFNLSFGAFTYQFIYVRSPEPKLIEYVVSSWGERVISGGMIALLFIE